MTDLRTAAQMALDALEKLNKDGWILADFEDEVYSSIEALRAALAQGEQEPHGYLWFTRHMEQRFTHRIPKEDERIGDVKPVYTAPPQREWQGLTDEEIREIWGSYFSRGVEFARAIEAELKEKNEY